LPQFMRLVLPKVVEPHQEGQQHSFRSLHQYALQPGVLQLRQSETVPESLSIQCSIVFIATGGDLAHVGSKNV
jgi:hypothetical protein